MVDDVFFGHFCKYSVGVIYVFHIAKSGVDVACYFVNSLTFLKVIINLFMYRNRKFICFASSYLAFLFK